MRTSHLKTEQGEAGLGCLGCFCQLLLVLAACDLAAGEKQDLAVLTASSHSSATLVALSWGLHFPLGRVFVKGCAERGVTCSSWKLSVVTAWGPQLRTFIDLFSWKVVFFWLLLPFVLALLTSKGAWLCHHQNSAALQRELGTWPASQKQEEMSE